ncbi:MAG TPA: molybdopterin-dependent oxidoreductase [Caulifigura sp.]|nr:molybdopterin-dependent oxidoreductase [Caulifigura sp.]
MLIVTAVGMTCQVRATADETSQAVCTLVTRNGSTVEITAADWSKLPRTKVEATDKHGAKGSYEGVAMSELMQLAHVPTGEKLRGDWLRCYVLVEAADGYQALYALPEFDPAFTDERVILADRRDGAPLGEKNGPFQVIAPAEKRGARWVRMVNRIKVVDPTPGAPSAGNYKE